MEISKDKKMRLSRHRFIGEENQMVLILSVINEVSKKGIDLIKFTMQDIEDSNKRTFSVLVERNDKGYLCISKVSVELKNKFCIDDGYYSLADEDMEVM